MSSSQGTGNIFLTTENLAFSLPLLAVCGIYAYFHFIPTKYGVPALVGAFVIYQIRNQIKAQHAKKLQHMDQKQLDELALKLEEEEKEDTGKDDAETKKLKAKKYLVEQRLAAEKKRADKAGKNGKKKAGNEDDDDYDLGDITAFAKGSRAAKKKS